jgi:hypothetical protein
MSHKYVMPTYSGEEEFLLLPTIVLIAIVTVIVIVPNAKKGIKPPICGKILKNPEPISLPGNEVRRGQAPLHFGQGGEGGDGLVHADVAAAALPLAARAVLQVDGVS